MNLKNIKVSKKLIVTILTLLLVVANNKLKLGIDDATLQNLAIVIGSYLLGQSAVDVIKEKNNVINVVKTKELLKNVLGELVSDIKKKNDNNKTV